MQLLTFYAARDNWEVIGLSRSGTPLTNIQVSAITRARLELRDGRSVDSESTPAAFDIGMAGKFGSSAVTGIGVNLAQTGWAPFPSTVARLVTFDSDHLGGYVWPEFQVELLA
jgi:hypothetical protein